MRYEITFAPEAIDDLRRLTARERSTVRDHLERHLKHEPTRVSKSRIKRLRSADHPQYRLRVGELRVFFDVRHDAVEVLAIVATRDAAEWLNRSGGER